MKNKYNLYGLRICSDFDLPEVLGSVAANAGDEGVCDISIERGSAPKDLKNSRVYGGFMHVVKDRCLYRFPDIASFLVEEGTRILVDPCPRVDPTEMRAFLFGSVMGTALHQRGLVPFHVSAVETPRGVVAFTGDAGAGKSTMAGEINHLTGWPIVTDDVAVLREVENEIVLSAGLGRLKLWKDAVLRLELDHRDYDRDSYREDKFHVVSEELFTTDAKPLSFLVMLKWGAGPDIRKLERVDAFAVVMNAIYRPYLLDMFGSRKEATKLCCRVAEHIDVLELFRKADEPLDRTKLNAFIRKFEN